MLFFKTALLTDLVEHFIKKISEDEDIKQYCLEHYKKELIILFGMDLKEPPNQEECPYIVIVPAEKKEGSTQKDFTYTVDILWCIYNTEINTANNISRFVGAIEADYLGQLILKCLASSLENAVINQIDYNVNALTEYPQFPGQMCLTINIPHIMGNNKIEF